MAVVFDFSILNLRLVSATTLTLRAVVRSALSGSGSFIAPLAWALTEAESNSPQECPSLDAASRSLAA